MAELLRISVQHLCTGRIDAAYLHGNRLFHRSRDKDRTAREWLRMGNNSIWISLAGKLAAAYRHLLPDGNIIYRIPLRFPPFSCNSGILPMLLATLCLVLASQGMGILMIGTLPTLRLGLSFASLWGVLSFSMCGLSFLPWACTPYCRHWQICSPLRHYFLIYVDQALNGYPMILLVGQLRSAAYFHDAPFLIAHRLKESVGLL